MSDEPIIQAYVTNLGKYNEGQLVGEYLTFPTTKEEVAELFKRIGIDGIRYEEFFITDYEISIDGIYNHLGEYESLDELNYLASKIDDMVGSELEIYEAAIENGDYCGSIKDLINLTENLDCYDYMESIEDEYDLGYYWVEESGAYSSDGMGALSNYIDYERFGRDIALDESGTFTTRGYIRNNGGEFVEVYDGITVPDEYHVFPEREMYMPEIQKNKPNRSRDER